jgi:thiol-disulfide isomerase/thioredoxin
MKIVKYVQPNCTPCKMVDAFLQHLGVSVDETVVIGQDISFEDARDKLGIMKTPTIIAFDENENKVEEVSGVGQGNIVAFFQKVGRL